MVTYWLQLLSFIAQMPCVRLIVVSMDCLLSTDTMWQSWLFKDLSSLIFLVSFCLGSWWRRCQYAIKASNYWIGNRNLLQAAHRGAHDDFCSSLSFDHDAFFFFPFNYFKDYIKLVASLKLHDFTEVHTFISQCTWTWRIFFIQLCMAAIFVFYLEWPKSDL